MSRRGNQEDQRAAALAERAHALMVYDDQQRAAAGCRLLAGVDEVGRGSLAGPLVAAAVILPARLVVAGLDDSKALSPPERRQAARRVMRAACCWAVAFVPAAYIDKHGLTAANMAAMRSALVKLRLRPELVLSDGYKVAGCPYPNRAVVHGDRLSQAIAAASCLAKVVRDEWLAYLGEHLYPGYGWERNAGYATPEHRRAVQMLGATAEHRALFLRGFGLPVGEGEEQTWRQATLPV